MTAAPDDLPADLRALIDDEDAYREAVAIFERTCPVCGRRFVPEVGHAVYDRASCRVLAWQHRTDGAPTRRV